MASTKPARAVSNPPMAIWSAISASGSRTSDAVRQLDGIVSLLRQSMAASPSRVPDVAFASNHSIPHRTRKKPSMTIQTNIG
jgi:hypothetical protein